MNEQTTLSESKEDSEINKELNNLESKAEESTNTEIKAEKLFEEFKEVSVTEFFRKNQSHLGYSGKLRSLTTIVHELVTNSVVWGTPVVVRHDDRVKLVKIGEFIDQLMLSGSKSIKTENSIESLREFKGIEVLCFDTNTLKLKYKRAKSVHMHKMSKGELIYKLLAVGGREVEATKHHSVFTLKGCQVVPIKVDELKIGDYMVVPKKCCTENEENEWLKINLLDEALSLSPDETKDIAVYGVKDILYNNNDLMTKIKSRLDKHDQRYTFYSNWMSCDRLPINLMRHLDHDELKQFYNCEISVKQCKHRLPVIMDVDHDLMAFLGIYAAEGNTRKNMTQVSLSFGIHETELIDYFNELIPRKFGLASQKVKAHSSAINLTISSKLMGFLLTKILKTGRTAKTKQVPDIVFNVRDELKKSFLWSYIAGDGCASSPLNIVKGSIKPEELNEKICAGATTSWDLFCGLQYLLSALGYSYSVQKHKPEERIVKGVLAKFSRSYSIEVWLKQSGGPLNFIPIQHALKEIKDSKLLWAIRSRGQKTISRDYLEQLMHDGGVDISDAAKRFLSGDLAVLQIKDIDMYPANDEYVYDFSVDGDENFIGGTGPICLHNSLDACEESGILPNIIVEINEVGKEHYRIIERDNGPGIPKKHVSSVFGKMLAGTKFHRNIQLRGQQGIGVAGVTMFSQMTTGRPTKVITSTGNGIVNEIKLMVDVTKNDASILGEEEYADYWKGTEVECELKGVMYHTGERSPYEYLRRTAITNPHAQFTFIDPGDNKIVFERSDKVVPKIPEEVQPHPKGLSIDDLVQMSKFTTATKTSHFLHQDIARVSEKKVREIQEHLSFDLKKKDPRTLSWIECEEIINAFDKVIFLAPSTEGLRPIGEEQIRGAILNVLEPEFEVVLTRRPTTYSGGIPFQVEVAVAFGGKSGRTINDKKEDKGFKITNEIMRFANRTPLLFDAGGCALTKAVNDVDWKRYNIKQFENAPITVVVNVSSTHIPYTSAGKQSIALEQEIIKEIKIAIQEVGRKFSRFHSKKQRAHEKEIRRKTLLKYSGELAAALAAITGSSEAEIYGNLNIAIESRITGESAGEITGEGEITEEGENENGTEHERNEEAGSFENENDDENENENDNSEN